MLNVANLYATPFAAILSGAKRTEWRRRVRRDPRLDAIAVGEPILLLECGTTRAIRATVRAILRFDYSDGVRLYAIRLYQPKLVSDSRRRIQGWVRREE